MTNDKDKATAKQIVKKYLDDYINDHQLEQQFAAALSATRLEAAKQARENERKQMLGAIRRVPATAAGASAFRKKLIEELYRDAANHDTETNSNDD